jgi:hypothetical protein
MNWKGHKSKRYGRFTTHAPGWIEEHKAKCQDGRSPGRDLNAGPPEHEVGVPATPPRRLLMVHFRQVLLHSFIWQWFCVDLCLCACVPACGKICQHGGTKSVENKGSCEINVTKHNSGKVSLCLLQENLFKTVSKYIRTTIEG